MRYLSNVATLDYTVDKCSGCGRCVEVCPHGVFAMRGARAYITDRDKCMECGACVKNCRTGAIAVEPGVGCASALITGFLRKGEPTCGPSCEPPSSGGKGRQGGTGGTKSGGACC